MISQKIKQLLLSIDLNQDIDSAESKIHEILNSEPDFSMKIAQIGEQINAKESDAPKKRKYLRAIIFSLSILASKNTAEFSKNDKNTAAIHLLFDLSIQGYQSAVNLLNTIGISHSTLLKKRLSELPLSDRHRNDKEIFLNEAIEEIKLSKFFSGTKGFSKGFYSLGKDKQNTHELYRTGKNIFALRTKKAR